MKPVERAEKSYWNYSWSALIILLLRPGLPVWLGVLIYWCQVAISAAWNLHGAESMSLMKHGWACSLNSVQHLRNFIHKCSPPTHTQRGLALMGGNAVPVAQEEFKGGKVWCETVEREQAAPGPQGRIYCAKLDLLVVEGMAEACPCAGPMAEACPRAGPMAEACPCAGLQSLSAPVTLSLRSPSPAWTLMDSECTAS